MRGVIWCGWWNFHINFGYAEMNGIAGTVNPMKGAGGDTVAVSHVVAVIAKGFAGSECGFFANDALTFDHMTVSSVFAEHPAATA